MKNKNFEWIYPSNNLSFSKAYILWTRWVVLLWFVMLVFGTLMYLTGNHYFKNESLINIIFYKTLEYIGLIGIILIYIWIRTTLKQDTFFYQLISIVGIIVQFIIGALLCYASFFLFFGGTVIIVGFIGEYLYQLDFTLFNVINLLVIVSSVVAVIMMVSECYKKWKVERYFLGKDIS